MQLCDAAASSGVLLLLNVAAASDALHLLCAAAASSGVLLLLNVAAASSGVLLLLNVAAASGVLLVLNVAAASGVLLLLNVAAASGAPHLLCLVFMFPFLDILTLNLFQGEKALDYDVRRNANVGDVVVGSTFSAVQFYILCTAFIFTQMFNFLCCLQDAKCRRSCFFRFYFSLILKFCISFIIFSIV